MEAASDRLSSLPDDLLFRIVSFLQFKEAVGTSILAKRWRFIPRGTRNLQFIESEFMGKQPLAEDREIKRNNFADFAESWIHSLGYSGWIKFLLAFSHPEDHLQKIQRIIDFAIDRRVEDLDLDFSDPTWDEDDIDHHHQTYVQLPPINECEFRKLQSLKLFSCNIPVISSLADEFSALKCVSLGWIPIRSSRMSDFLNKSPFLESLSMKRCGYSDYHLEIVSKSLRNLVMEKCCSTEPDMMLEFYIDAPKMKLFNYSGVLLSVYCESLNRDMEASLDFCLQREFGEFGEMLHRLLNQLGGVKTLTVCTYMLQVLPLWDDEPFGLLPKLDRLKHLTLKASLSRNEFYGISFFLNSCPNLEILTINLNTPERIFPEYEPPLSMQEHAFLMKKPGLQLVYPCVKRELKRVVVEGFKGTRGEMEVLRYLLTNGRVLETLQIEISDETAADGTSMEETYAGRVYSLLKFKKASQEGVRILVCGRRRAGAEVLHV